jgi:TrmH family RNA methyltransferase
LISEDFVPPHIVGIVPLVVQTEILATLSSVRSGSRVIGVVRRESLPTPPKTLTGVALALCGVGDPGNVGTLLRSAAAFDTEVVVLGAPAADPTSPKAVRAGMGATFFVPTLTLDDPAQAYPEARLVALDGAGETDINDVDFAGPVVIALGAERDGLPHSIRKRADVICRIPQSDKAESLNVAAAGAIVLALSYRSNA